MKILLVFDEKFIVDKDKLEKLVQQKTKFVEFDLYNEKFALPTELITKPKTFKYVHKHIETVRNGYDRIFCFTFRQYDDNFFFHEYRNISIFSFHAWNYLTDLPISNGILYFIIDYLALEINHVDFRHHETTGCIYDFLRDKRGIDDGMRQARFCSNCLERISDTLTSENDFKIFDDLKLLMNLLSEASRWNKDILVTEKTKINSNSTLKRKPKNTDGIKIVIASPGDTSAERKSLLDSLEVKFRRDGHESHCGFRIMVNGWEDLASQPGYPQDLINKKIIAESDFVIAVFRHKLGTPTKDTVSGKKRADSGTVEELLQTLDSAKDNHPIGMAYFYSHAPLVSLENPDKVNIEKEWVRLSEFKEIIKEKMIYKPYTENNDLITTVLKDLEKNIIDYLIK